MIILNAEYSHARADGVKVLKLPSMAGMWITEYVQILAEPDVDEEGRLVALANAYGTLAFVELSVRVGKEGKAYVTQQG